MANKRIDVEFNFVDNFTAGFKNTISTLTSGTKAGERAWKGVAKAGDSIASFGSKVTAGVTVPIVGAATAAVSKFAEVDKTMQLTNSTMGNSAEEAKVLSDAMKSAASNSTFGMSDAATATLNFARAGLKANDAAAALAPTMNLAAGEGGDLNTVSAGLVATINGFHGSFNDAKKYADVFAAACNNSALDVNSLSESFSIAAPIFSSAGYSVNDAALYMGVMANNGMDANTAATSLKTGLARLVSPAKDGAEMIAKLGLSFTNSDGSMKDTLTIQRELHDSFSKLSESEQIAAASAIFGKQQMAPWLGLINTAPEDVKKLNSSLESAAGTSNSMANSMMSGFGGGIEKLKSSIDVLLTSLGEVAGKYLTPIIEKIQVFVDKLNNASPAQQDMIVKALAMAAAVGPVIGIFGKGISIIGGAGAKINGLIGFINKFKPASMIAAAGGKNALSLLLGPSKNLIKYMLLSSKSVTGLRAVIAALTSPLGIVLTVICAIIIVVVAVRKHMDLFRSAINKSSPSVSGLGTKFKALGDAGKKLLVALKPIADFFGTVITVVVGIAANALVGFLGGVVEVITGIINVFTGLSNFLVNVFTGNWKGAWESIKDIFSGIMDVIKGIIDGIKGAIGGIVDGVKGVVGFFTGNNKSKTTKVQGKASGTTSWEGGLVQVHERGGEIMDLPRGTRIYPHDESVAMARAEGNKTISIAKLADSIVVHDEADIDKITDSLTRKLMSAAGNMGGRAVANMA